MPIEWTPTTLGQCVDFFSGGTPSKSNPDYWNGEIPWVSAKDMKQFYLSDSEDHITERGAANGTRLVQPGTVLLLVRGMTLHNTVPISVVVREMAFNQDIKALRAHSDVDQRFIAFWLLSNRQTLLSAVHPAGHGTGVLATDRLKELNIELPSKEVQSDIADVFQLLQDKIEQNRRTSEALERLARAIFKAWFVDFEPVRAKADGAKSFPGMPPEAFASLPITFTPSPLGPIPEGWGAPEFASLVYESKERVANLDVPAYSSTNEGVFPRDERFTKDLSKTQKKNLLIRRNDLVFGLSREILNFGVMYDQIGAVSPVYKVFRPLEMIVSEGYVEAAIRARIGYYRQIVKSSSREGQGIMVDQLLAISILVPQSEVQKAFRHFEETSLAIRDHLRQESSKLAEVRDYLLPRLFSGQVRVKETADA